MKAASQYQLEQGIELLSEVLKRHTALTPSEQEQLMTVYVGLARLCDDNRRSEPFHRWLANQKGRRDHVGDLARWSEQDKKWPRDGDEGLTPFVDRLRLTNLATDALQVPGAIGSDLVEHYLYPAWDEYMDASEHKPMLLVVGGTRSAGSPAMRNGSRFVKRGV